KNGYREGSRSMRRSTVLAGLLAAVAIAVLFGFNGPSTSSAPIPKNQIKVAFVSYGTGISSMNDLEVGADEYLRRNGYPPEKVFSGNSSGATQSSLFKRLASQG